MRLCTSPLMWGSAGVPSVVEPDINAYPPLAGIHGNGQRQTALAYRVQWPVPHPSFAQARVAAQQDQIPGVTGRMALGTAGRWRLTWIRHYAIRVRWARDRVTHDSRQGCDGWIPGR
jgi:hypothetical protein